MNGTIGNVRRVVAATVAVTALTVSAGTIVATSSSGAASAGAPIIISH